MIDRFGCISQERARIGRDTAKADWVDQVEENRTGYCTFSLTRNPQSTRHLAMTDGQLVKNSTLTPSIAPFI